MISPMECVRLTWRDGSLRRYGCFHRCGGNLEHNVRPRSFGNHARRAGVTTMVQYKRHRAVDEVLVMTETK